MKKMKTRRIGRNTVQNTSRGRGVMNGREAPSAGRLGLSMTSILTNLKWHHPYIIL